LLYSSLTGRSLDKKLIEKIFLETIRCATGYGTVSEPAGTVCVNNSITVEPALTLFSFFQALLSEKKSLKNSPRKSINNSLLHTLLDTYREARARFLEFYTSPVQYETLLKKYSKFLKENFLENKARLITEIWAPEITEPDASILSRWKLYEVKKSKTPLVPEQIIIQLNALYTVPLLIPDNLAQEITDELKERGGDFGRKAADYDHPVPLFTEEKDHELINCLKELDADIAFEKSIGTFARGFRLCVVVSLSVTHEKLDYLTELWIKSCIEKCRLNHLKILLLTERTADAIKRTLLHRPFTIFTVKGRYANHFNALKYVQLLLEKAYGYRAGFKLDTDEGIRSKALYETTGKSWFQTLCHKYWGADAVDSRGVSVVLGINTGEYMNNSDIISLGYRNALREPDIKPPDGYLSRDIFFHKAFAHAKAASLYNKFNQLEDFISHPVVKGGGYGIRNDSLRTFVPFAFAKVGRAEDQQFYFYGLSKGLKGIFHPDLRIAHYKEKVASAESVTETHRFIGDMYRLVLFEYLAGMLGVKKELDPMPGIFAGKLAFCQAFFTIVYRAYSCCTENEIEKANSLVHEGLDEIIHLNSKIQSGQLLREFQDEENQWRAFVRAVERIDAHEARRFFNSLMIISI